MNKKNPLLSIDINSPVILGFAGLSFLLLLMNFLTRGYSNLFFAIRYTSWLDPFMYLRLFTHIFAHQNLSHYTGNFLLILAVGPLIEEKYGSRNLTVMILLTALATGLINILFFPRIMLIGASGVVFMLILLASFTNIREGRFPLTVILVGILYIGNEILTGIFSNDNISQISHIVGGLCGGGFGYLIHMRWGDR